MGVNGGLISSAQNIHYARSYKSIPAGLQRPRHSLSASLRHDRCHMHAAHCVPHLIALAVVSHF